MQENVTYRRKVSHWEIRMGLQAYRERINSAVKAFGVKEGIRFAMCFPDVYETGIVSCGDFTACKCMCNLKKEKTARYPSGGYHITEGTDIQRFYFAMPYGDGLLRSLSLLCCRYAASDLQKQKHQADAQQNMSDSGHA